jgi:nucleotide-binding universal stress UspA family protein
MYRHLIVPLDDSPLAVEVAHQAVKLASKLGAKVTFFHAPADYGASSLGALERVLAPAAFNEHVAGEARAILAKAETVARAANVSFDSAMTTSDRPHEAILEVAESRGCDLIFMASHGRRGLKGLILGSQTRTSALIPGRFSCFARCFGTSRLFRRRYIIRRKTHTCSACCGSEQAITTRRSMSSGVSTTKAGCWSASSHAASRRTRQIPKRDSRD